MLKCMRCMDSGCGDCSGRVDAEDRHLRKLATHALKYSDNFPIGYATTSAKPGDLLTISMNAKEALQKDTRDIVKEYGKFPSYVEELARKVDNYIMGFQKNRRTGRTISMLRQAIAIAKCGQRVAIISASFEEARYMINLIGKLEDEIQVRTGPIWVRFNGGELSIHSSTTINDYSFKGQDPHIFVDHYAIEKGFDWRRLAPRAKALYLPDDRDGMMVHRTPSGCSCIVCNHERQRKHSSSSNTPTPTKMQSIRRLLDFNDWTIALLYENEPGHQAALIAFNGEGAYHQSREYKVTVDDTAFEWRGGKLYSGKLEYTPTERDIAREEVEKANEAVRKHNDRIKKQIEKLAGKMK